MRKKILFSLFLFLLVMSVSFFTACDIREDNIPNSNSGGDSSYSDGADDNSGQTSVEKYKVTVQNGVGSGNYKAGDLITINANVPEGEEFDFWASDGEIVSDKNPYTFSVSGSASFTAFFKKPGADALSSYTKTLYKKSDKDFKVLNLTDIQLHDGEDVSKTLSVIDQLVEREQPDLIVHLGDLINDSRTYPSQINYVTVLDKIDSYGIPWTAIMGNHDYETYQAGYVSMKASTTSDDLIAKFTSYENCIFVRGPENVSNKSNYIINIVDESTGKLVHSLYMMDSGLSGLDNTHAAFYRDAVAYSKRLAVAYSKRLNGWENVGSTIYTHIGIPEYGDALEVSKAVEYRNVTGANPRNPNDLAAGSREIFKAIKDLGVTDTVICGHDHDNAYYVEYQGVRLAYSMKSSDGDGFSNPAEIGGSVLKIGEETEFYYSKANISFECDESGNLTVNPDALPYWKYSGATLKFDIELNGTSGKVLFSLLGTNLLRYNVAEKDRYGSWNRLTQRISVDVDSKTVNYGTLTLIDGNKYSYQLDLSKAPLNADNGENACGEETLRLIYFSGGNENNKYSISNVRYEFEDITETDQVDLSAATINDISDQKHSFGQFVRPVVTVKINGSVLSRVEDVLVIYENNVSVGEATVRVVPSGKGAHKYKGELVGHFNIVNNPDGDTLPGHESASLVESNFTVYGGGLKAVENWYNSGKSLYFEVKKTLDGKVQSGQTFTFCLFGKNKNREAIGEIRPTGDWNRLTARYVLEFTDDSVIVYKEGDASKTNIAIVSELGDRWFGVQIDYKDFELNTTEDALGNENETFTLLYISDVTRSFKLDGVDSERE